MLFQLPHFQHIIFSVFGTDLSAWDVSTGFCLCCLLRRVHYSISKHFHSSSVLIQLYLQMVSPLPNKPFLVNFFILSSHVCLLYARILKIISIALTKWLTWHWTAICLSLLRRSGPQIGDDPLMIS